MTARDIYARRFRAIGIPAVAAGVSLGRPATAAGRSTPSPLDIPAILRFGPETE